MDGFSLPTFLSSLGATLSGSLVAAFVALTILRRQRKDKYEETLLNASRAAITAMMTFSTEAARDDGDEDRASMRAQAELTLLTASARGQDRGLAALIALQFEHLADRRNSARSRCTAELAVHVSTLVAREIPRRAIASEVQDMASRFRPHQSASAEGPLTTQDDENHPLKTP